MHSAGNQEKPLAPAKAGNGFRSRESMMLPGGESPSPIRGPRIGIA